MPVPFLRAYPSALYAPSPACQPPCTQNTHVSEKRAMRMHRATCTLTCHLSRPKLHSHLDTNEHSFERVFEVILHPSAEAACMDESSNDLTAIETEFERETLRRRPIPRSSWIPGALNLLSPRLVPGGGTQSSSEEVVMADINWWQIL